MKGKVLITGGAGYIGSVLAIRLVKEGYDVVIYDSAFYENQNVLSLMDTILEKDISVAEGLLDMPEGVFNSFKNFKFVKGDIRDTESLNKLFSENKFDYVFHLGELVGHYRCEKDKDLTRAINYIGTKNIFDFAMKQGALFVCNSSSSVYGTREDADDILKEDAELFTEGLDTYCVNKLLTEKYMVNEGDKNKDFKFIILRPATVGGLSPRMRLTLLPNHFTYAAVIQKKLSLTQPNNYRAIIDINDMIESYMAMLNADEIKNGIFNMGNHNMSKQEYLNEIIKAVKPDVVEVKPIGEMGNERNLRISSEKFEQAYNFKASVAFRDTIKPLVGLLREKPDVFSKNNFKGVLNVPLKDWEMLLS